MPACSCSGGATVAFRDIAFFSVTGLRGRSTPHGETDDVALDLVIR